MSFEAGIILSVASVVIGVLGYQLNKSKVQSAEQKEAKADATREAVIETKLNHISNGVDNIRIDLKTNERQVNELKQEMVEVRESTKSAHKRIDKMEGI